MSKIFLVKQGAVGKLYGESGCQEIYFSSDYYGIILSDNNSFEDCVLIDDDVVYFEKKAYNTQNYIKMG